MTWRDGLLHSGDPPLTDTEEVALRSVTVEPAPRGFKSPHLRPKQQVRASSAPSGRRSLHAAAAPRPRAQIAVQLGRCSATRRPGPGPPTMTTERSRCLQAELRVRCHARPSGLERHPGSGRCSSSSRMRQDGQTRASTGRVVSARHTDPLHESRVQQRGRGRGARADTDAGHRTACIRTRHAGAP
jgi:hypothetical protein